VTWNVSQNKSFLLYVDCLGCFVTVMERGLTLLKRTQVKQALCDPLTDGVTEAEISSLLKATLLVSG
jgi:hypothetical protein